LLIKELNYLTTLPLPIPSDIQIVSPTKDIPSTPRLVEILEQSRSKEAANLNFLIYMFSCRLGVNDEFIPNIVFDLRLVPLFMVEHFVVAFNPNGPKCNTAKKVPIFYFIFYFCQIS
jgi:hypothetical protein